MYEFTGILSTPRVVSGIDASQIDLSPVNPYNRDLPPEQADVLRDLIYINHIIEYMIPTSLPGDDFELFSNCLRSLETRTDLSWRVFDEADIWSSLTTAYSYRKSNMIEEPFSISHRLKALIDHWGPLARLPTRPERWEKESDTTFIPPLIHDLPVRDHIKANCEDDIYKLSLTAKQSAAADEVYQKWLKRYKRKASYFKDHPLKPIGWVGVTRSELSIRNGWATLLHDSTAEQSVKSKLAADKTYKPIYEKVPLPPFSWRVPGEIDQRTDEDKKRERAEAKLEREQTNARKALQNNYLNQIGA